VIGAFLVIFRSSVRQGPLCGDFIRFSDAIITLIGLQDWYYLNAAPGKPWRFYRGFNSHRHPLSRKR
jgi:hypothetical protein